MGVDEGVTLAREERAMPRPHLLLRLALPAVAVAVAVGVWLAWPRTAISLENYARVQKGMTVGELEGLLGGLPRNESTGPLVYDDGIYQGCCRILPHWAHRYEPWRKHPNSYEWISDEAIIYVFLDDDDRVSSHGLYPVRRADQNPLATLRRWLHL